MTLNFYEGRGAGVSPALFYQHRLYEHAASCVLYLGIFCRFSGMLESCLAACSNAAAALSRSLGCAKEAGSESRATM